MTRRVTLAWRGGCANGPDRIGGPAELVVCHMGHRDRMASGASRFLGGAGHLSGRRMRRIGRGSGLGHRNLAPGPSARLFERLAWAVVTGAHLFEKVQDVLCAIGRPHGQKAMISVLEGAAPAQGDEPGIPPPRVERHAAIFYRFVHLRSFGQMTLGVLGPRPLATGVPQSIVCARHLCELMGLKSSFGGSE